MDGIPFTSWVDLTNQTTDTTNVVGAENWQMEWDNANSRFVVLGKQVCGSSGCTLTALPAPANVTGTVFDNQPINGWLAKAPVVTVADGVKLVSVQPLLPQTCLPSTTNWPLVSFHCICQFA